MTLLLGLRGDAGTLGDDGALAPKFANELIETLQRGVPIGLGSGGGAGRGILEGLSSASRAQCCHHHPNRGIHTGTLLKVAG